jgi:hypothetical protein
VEVQIRTSAGLDTPWSFETDFWASSGLPWTSNHLGDSGMKRIPMPRMAAKTTPRPMGMRQEAELVNLLVPKLKQAAIKMPRVIKSWYVAVRVPRMALGAVSA